MNQELATSHIGQSLASGEVSTQTYIHQLHNQAQVWLISTEAGNQRTGEPHEGNQGSKKKCIELSS